MGKAVIWLARAAILVPLLVAVVYGALHHDAECLDDGGCTTTEARP